MKNTEMEWRESIINGYEINDIIIDISYIYTNNRPYLITIDYNVENDFTNYRIKKVFTND